VILLFSVLTKADNPTVKEVNTQRSEYVLGGTGTDHTMMS